jgi:hypothetical protein
MEAFAVRSQFRRTSKNVDMKEYRIADGSFAKPWMTGGRLRMTGMSHGYDNAITLNANGEKS